MNPVTPEPKAKLILINFTCWSCMPRSHKKIIKTRVRRHAITVYIFIGGKINTNTTPSIHSATFYLPETRKNSNRNKEVVVALRWLTNKLTTTIHRSLKQIINKLDKKKPKWCRGFIVLANTKLSENRCEQKRRELLIQIRGMNIDRSISNWQAIIRGRRWMRPLIVRMSFGGANMKTISLRGW